MNLLAIDPGFAKDGGGCALAVFKRDRLIGWKFERPEDWGATTHRPFTLDLVIVEQAQQDARSWGVPPATLVRLAWDGALLGGLYAGATGAEFKAAPVSVIAVARCRSRSTGSSLG